MSTGFLKHFSLLTMTELTELKRGRLCRGFETSFTGGKTVEARLGYTLLDKTEIINHQLMII